MVCLAIIMLRSSLCLEHRAVASTLRHFASSALDSSAGLDEMQSLLEPLVDSTKKVKSTRMEALQELSKVSVRGTRPLNLCNAINDGLHVAMDTDPR